MKRLLLLLLMVATFGLVGCKDKWLDVKPSGIITSESVPERIQRIAKELNVDIEGVEFIDINESIKKTVTFTGLKKGKIWIREYNYDTKMEIFSADGKEKLDTIIKYTEPYVGEIIDTLTHVDFSFPIHDNNNNSLIRMNYGTKKNKTISNLLFCEDGVIVNSKNIDDGLELEAFGIKYYKGSRYWLNNHWVLKYTVKEDIPNSASDIQYVYFDFFSLSGNLLMSYKINYSIYYGDIFNLNDITPLSMTEFILNNEKGSEFNFKRINIEKSNCVIWSTNINLNIPNNAKVSLSKQELVNNNDILKLSYNITLYDGTKSTKIVNIDVNTGKYTVN